MAIIIANNRTPLVISRPRSNQGSGAPVSVDDRGLLCAEIELKFAHHNAQVGFIFYVFITSPKTVFLLFDSLAADSANTRPTSEATGVSGIN